MKLETGGEDGAVGTGAAATLRPTVEPVAETITETDAARFTIPRQPEGFLTRPRLLEHLELGSTRPLTLVSAPAGSGKTVLVSTWALRGQDQGPVAWVTLQSGDELPARFWSSFFRGLGRAGVDLRLPRSLDSSLGVNGGYVDRVLSALAQHGQGQSADPMVVVLDCEAEISTAVAEDLDTLLRRSGGLLRLVVVTRVDPVLPLHRYRLAGTVLEIRMADLALTLGEARDLLEDAGIDLSESALETLVARTQGWVAGLRFAAVALDRQADTERAAMEFSGDIGDVAEYLVAEVLDAQPAGGRQLLLESSIVDLLRPGLSEALAGHQAQRALASLARGNAFLDEVADSPGVYSYQPLFRELLRAQLAYESPERVPELHRAAAAWLADQGMVEEAVRHSAAAGDWEGAAGCVIDDLAIGQLILPGEARLAEGLSRLPDDTDGAAACLVRAALAMAVFDVEACDEYLFRAEIQLDGVHTARWSAAALALQAVRLTHAVEVGNVEKALGAASTAERLLRMQPSERVEQHPELLVLIESGKGAAWLSTGRLDEAMDAFDAGARAADRPGCELSLISCLGQLALLAAMRGQLRKAGELAARVALSAHEAGIDPPASPGAAVALAWVNTELYDLAAARRYAQSADSTATSQDPTARVMLALVDSRLRRARGDLEGALARIADVRSGIPQPPRWLQDLLRIEEAELNVATGEPALAVRMVQSLSDPQSPQAILVLARATMAGGGSIDSRASACRGQAASLPTRVGGWLLEATRLLDDGEELAAGQALERSLRLAAPERLRRPFRESSPQVRRLLRGDRQLAAEHGWLGAATLNDAPFSAPRRDSESDSGTNVSIQADQTASSPLLESLTEKEREVLGHLAALLTTDEIAGAMFVSVNTVRTHVRNLLRKLDASRRNEAVRRARDLGIIAGLTAVEPTGGSRPA